MDSCVFSPAKSILSPNLPHKHWDWLPSQNQRGPIAPMDPLNRDTRIAADPYPAPLIFDHSSFNETVRLNTSFPLVESGSTQK